MQVFAYRNTERSARQFVPDRGINLRPNRAEPAPIPEYAPEPPLPEPVKRRRLGVPAWVEAIIREEATAHDVTAEDIMSMSRRHMIVSARAAAMYRVMDAKRSLTPGKLGVWFDRDHTSVLNLVARHAEEYGLPRLSGFDRDRQRERNRMWWVNRRTAQSNEVRG